jgi:SRSO17 transposase
LPIALRLYHNRQGLIQGKKEEKKGRNKSSRSKHDPNQRTRPEPALELLKLVAAWFPNEEILVTGDSVSGGKSVLSHLPTNVHLISHVHPKAALSEPAPAKTEKTKGRPRKKGRRWPGRKPWAEDSHQPWSRLDFDQFGLPARLAVKTIPALFSKAGRDRLLTIVLVRDLEGKRPDQMFYCTQLDWTARQILSASACRWAIEQGDQQMKEELGLDHFEGRSWRGFHHHACLVMLAEGVLAWEQLRAKQTSASLGKNSDQPPRIALPALRRALQRFLRPRAKPDCNYCYPFHYLLIQRSQILTE